MSEPELEPTLAADDSACPTPDQLERFLSGRLEDDESESIEDHFSSCDRCLSIANDLTLDGDVQQDTLDAHSPVIDRDVSANRLVDRIKAGQGVKPSTFVRRGGSSNKEARVQFDVPDGYEVLGELGRGGMGVVYKARHIGLNRTVALKMILGASHASQAALDRFTAEGMATAKLNHPGIVQVYDSGQHKGVPYIALRFIEGGTLSGLMPDGAPLAPKQAAAIVGQLADAIAYAHSQGVIHRDLKPENVLIAKTSASDAQPSSTAPTSFNPIPKGRSSSVEPSLRHRVKHQSELGVIQPKITDFGLAKELNDDAGLTQTGAVLGTPSFMAPEQASGDSSLHSPSVDIYALGAILYQTLTGRAPFRGESTLETIRQVLHNEPVSPRKLSPSVPVDLETITLKCLSKEPASRYATAQDLADDLRRYLNREPISARPISTTMRLVRWTQRHPATAATVFGIALLLTSVAIGSLIAAGRFKSLATEKTIESQKARARAIEANDARLAADAATDRANKIAEKARRRLYASEMMAASVAASEPSGLSRVQQLLKPWIPTDGEEDLRGWEWDYHHGLTNSGLILEPEAKRRAALSAGWSADDQSILFKDHNGKTHFYDANSGQYLKSLGDPLERWGAACLSPDGSKYLTYTVNDMMRLWDLTTRKLLHEFPAPNTPIEQCRWSQNGKWIAALGDGHLMIWDAQTLEVLFDKKANFDVDVFLHPTRPKVSFQVSGGGNRTFDFKTDERIPHPRESTQSISWNLDGSLMALHQWDSSVLFADAKTGEVVSSWEGPGNRITDTTWHPDGKTVALSCRDCSVYIVNARSGKVVRTLKGHLDRVTCAAWSRDSSRILSVGFGNHVRVRSMNETPMEFLIPIPNGDPRVGAVAFDRSSQRFVAHLPDGIAIRSLTSDRDQVILRQWKWGDPHATAFAFRPDQKELAILDSDWSLRLYNLESQTTRELDPGRENHPVRDAQHRMDWDSSGRFLVSKLGQRHVAVFDVDQGKRWDWKVEIDRILSVRFSPNGNKVVCGVSSGVWVWDFQVDAAAKRLEPTAGYRGDAAWSPDGKWLAMTLRDDVQIRDASTLELKKTLVGPTRPASCLNWSPDGSRLVAGSEDGRAYLWDIKTGYLVSRFADFPWYCNGVAWSPDGKKLVTMSTAGSHIRQIKD